jgi:hypothetical protein
MIATDVTRGTAWRSPLASLTICLFAVVGCYRYVSVPVTELTPAMAVRMQLSAVAVDRIRTGPDSLMRLLDGFNVSGIVSRLSSDTLLLAVPTSYMEANVRLKTQLHDLRLFRSDVQRVESRRLDRARTTWTSVAVGVLAAASTAYVINRGGRSTGSNTKPVDPAELLVPSSFALGAGCCSLALPAARY